MAYQQNPSIIGLPAQTLANLSQNPLQGLMAGYQFGNALYEQQQQRGLQQDLAQAFDPQTGQVDTAKVLRALMQRDPATGIKFMQQKRLEDQQQAALQWLAGEQTATPTGTGGGTPPGAGLAGISPEARKQLLIGGLLKGDIGGAAMKLGELQQNAYLQDYARGQEMINVTDPQTGAVYQVPRGQAMPGPSAQPIPSGQPAPSAQGIPSGQPAPSAQGIPSGQPAPPVRSIPSGQPPAVAGTPGGPISIPADTNGHRFQITLDTWRGMDQDSRLALLKQMTPGQRTLFQQQLYGPPGSEGTMAPSIPATPPVVSGPQGIPKTPPAQLPPPLTQNAYGPGIPTASSPPGLLVKRPPAQEQVEQETIKQQYQIAAEQRRAALEQQQAQQNAALKQQYDIASEQRATPNKLQLGGEDAWVESVYKPALLEQKSNTESLQKLQLMEGLNQPGKTGPGAPFWKGVRTFLSAAGIPQSVIDVTPDQELTALSNNLVWQTLAQQKGPQTDLDFARMQQIWPSLEKTPEANQFLIDSSRAIVQRRQQQIDFYRKNYPKYAATGNPSALDDAWNATPAAQRSVWDEPGMKRWAGTAGGTQAPGTPGTAAPAGQPAPTSTPGPAAAPTGTAAPTTAGGGKTFDQQAVIDLSKKYNKSPAEIRRALEAKGYTYAP